MKPYYMPHTMKWHKEPYLSVLNPLSDAIPCTPLDAGDKGAFVGDAVEDLAHRLHGGVHVRLGAMLRERALACTAAHLAGGARCLWIEDVRGRSEWL